MTAIFTPVKTAPTTVPNDTHVEVPYAIPDGVLLYQPDCNAFIALYGDEWILARADAHQNMTAIDELQEANRDVTEKSLKLHALQQLPNAAKADLAAANKALATALDTLAKKSEAAKSRIEAINDQTTDGNKLIELVPMTMKRLGATTTPIYVSGRHLQNAARDRRVYLVDGSAERARPPKEKLINGVSVNFSEIRKRLTTQVQDHAKFEKKWKLAPKDADAYSGILTDWAKVMGASATTFLERTTKEVAGYLVSADKFDANDPYRIIDLKPEAQFMRWSAGAGAEAIFMPLQGNTRDPRDTTMAQKFKRAAKSAQFSVKANADASFSVGEAKIEALVYFPHAAGWHLTPATDDLRVDLGFFRLRADLKLYALAGASLALEAGVAMMVNADRQGLVGRPARNGIATAKIGAKAEAKVFAGLKEGVELAGALQWLNPEGDSDMSAPKKADPNKAIAEYVDVASLRCEANAIQGLAVNYGFECDYRRGNFVIAAKCGACLGLGGTGSVAAKVGVEQIAKFFMFVAHQLKDANPEQVAKLMGEIAISVHNQIFYMVVAGNRRFEDFVGVTVDRISKEFDSAVKQIRIKRDSFIEEMYKKMKPGWGPYAYMPPEARSVIIASIAEVISEPRNIYNDSLRGNAAFVINELLSTTQSLAQLHTTLERVNLSMSAGSGRAQGVQLINNVVDGTLFANCVNRCEIELATVTPLIGRPFLRNDAPEIYLAKFPLHHPAYLVA